MIMIIMLMMSSILIMIIGNKFQQNQVDFELASTQNWACRCLRRHQRKRRQAALAKVAQRPGWKTWTRRRSKKSLRAPVHYSQLQGWTLPQTQALVLF